ncbi:MAG TPA: hypothetical protein VGD15_19610 [Kribbella sp.]
MPRPTDWDAIGLSGDPTPGDPDQISELAGIFQHLGGKARDIYNAIETVMNTADNSVFSGAAADALRGKVDNRLRGHVEDVAWAFESSAAAVRDWHAVVVDQQSRADAALSAGRGLAKDDPERQRQADLASQAGQNQSEQGQSIAHRIESVSHIALPISACKLFWEAFQWLAIILIIPALVFGGPIALLALGVNLALFIKTAVDFANGDAQFLDLFLAGLGLIAPTTKALPIFNIIRGVGQAVMDGAKVFLQGFKTIFSREFLLNNFLPGLLKLPALASIGLRDSGLWVISGLTHLPAFAGGIVRAGTQFTLNGITRFPGLVSGLPSVVGRGFSYVGQAIKTGAMASWKFLGSSLGGTRWSRLLLPVDAGEINAFGFWGALRIGVFNRGVLGQYRFGAPLTGTVGRTISAVPIHPPAVSPVLADGINPLALGSTPPSIQLGALRSGNDLHNLTGQGFHAARQLDSLEGVNLSTLTQVRAGDLGISATGTTTTIQPSGLHLPATAGTPSLTSALVNGVPAPGLAGVPAAGVTGVPASGLHGVTATNLPQVATTSIGDLLAPAVRTSSGVPLSPALGPQIGQQTVHGLVANQTRLHLDELVPTPGQHIVASSSVQPPTVDRVGAALQLVDTKPTPHLSGLDVKPGNLSGIESRLPGPQSAVPAVSPPPVTLTGTAHGPRLPGGPHAMPTPGEAGTVGSGAAVTPTGGFTPGDVGLAGSAKGKEVLPPEHAGVDSLALQGIQPPVLQPGLAHGRPARVDVPLTAVPEHPGIFVRVQRQGTVVSHQLFNGGPAGRLDPLPGGQLRFTDAATGQTFRFDRQGGLVDQGTRLTGADGVLKVDDQILLREPGGAIRLTDLAGHDLPKQPAGRMLDQWNRDFAGRADEFRRPGDSQAMVDQRMNAWRDVHKAQADFDAAQYRLEVLGHRTDGPSSGLSVGDQVRLDFQQAQHNLHEVKDTFRAAHGMDPDAIAQRLDNLLVASVQQRPRLVAGGRPIELPGQTGVQLFREGNTIQLGPGADLFRVQPPAGGLIVVERLSGVGGDVVHSWTLKLGFRPSVVAETLTLTDGPLAGRFLDLRGTAGSLETVLKDVEGSWPIRAQDDRIVVATQDGPIVYDRNGSFQGPGATATSQLDVPVPPAGVAGDAATRWSSSVDLSRTHLGAAAKPGSEVGDLMRKVQIGAYTSKRGYGGYVHAGDHAQLIQDSRQFHRITQNLLLEGPNGRVTLYRGVSMDPESAAAGQFVERLPSSTSNNFEFQLEWARNGAPGNRFVFEIDVPAGHGKLASAYPPGYTPGHGEAAALNQSQWEVTLAPTTLVRTGPTRVENGMNIIPVRAEQIPLAELQTHIDAAWPGMSLATAFDDFSRAFGQDSIRRWHGFEDVEVRPAPAENGLATTLTVGKPGFADELTITVSQHPQDKTISVDIAGGDRAFSMGPWKGTDLGDLAAQLRGNVLHDNDLFLNLPKPASWSETPAPATPAPATAAAGPGTPVAPPPVTHPTTGVVQVFSVDGTLLERQIPLDDVGGGNRGAQLVVHDAQGNLALQNTAGAFLGGTVELHPGGGYRVGSGSTYQRFDADGFHQARGFAATVPGESGYLERGVNGGGRWLDANFQPVPNRTVTVNAATREITVTRPGGQDIFDFSGGLRSQGFTVVRDGRTTNFRYVVDHTTATPTWTRTTGTGQVTGAGAFHHGKVDLSGADNGRIRLLSSTGNPVEVFERRLLPGGLVLDSFRRTDTLGFGSLDRRTTWATYDQTGGVTSWGTRHFDTTGLGWRDVDRAGHSVREYREGLQKYDASTGHVLAVRQGDGSWQWHRYDDHAAHVAQGERVPERIGDGWTDTITRVVNGEQVRDIAQQKWGSWHLPETAGHYKEFKLSSGPGGVDRPGSWEQLSRQGKDSGSGQRLPDGFLTVVRQGEQRPPVWVRESPILGNPRPGGVAAHLADDNRFQLFRWERTGQTPGEGVRYTAMDGATVDVNAQGNFVRSTGKLADGTTLKVGDHVSPPPAQQAAGQPLPPHAAGQAQVPQGALPWEAGTQRGYRVQLADDPGGRVWQDVVGVPGPGAPVVREGLPGGVVREYPDPAVRTVWIERDAHGSLTGTSYRSPVPGQHDRQFIVATGAADSSRWQWRAVDHRGVQLSDLRGERQFFRGSTDASLSWDDSFRDFDAAGNLVRERRMLDGGRYVDSWRGIDAQGAEQWRSGLFGKTGVRVPGADDLVRQWRVGDHWSSAWQEGAVHFKDVRPAANGVGEQVFRDVPLQLENSPLRVREYGRTADGLTEYRQWKEFDHGQVVRERRLSGGNYLETDAWRGQWKLYDGDGRLLGERSDNGLVFELDGNGRLRLTGNEYDFRGPLTEIRGWGRRIREGERMPWLLESDWTGPAGSTIVARGNDAFREARYAPAWRTVAQKAALEFAQEFVLEFTANLIVNAIVSAAQNKPFTGNDALKSLMNAGVSATLKTGLGTALNETRLGGELRDLRLGLANIDGGKHWNRRPINHDRTWANEWAGNESATRWRGGVYDFGFTLPTVVLSGFVNGTMNAAIFGVTNADGTTVRLSGWEAVADGGINALASLTTGVSTALVKNIAATFSGSRFFHRQGFGDFWVQLPFKLFEKSIQSVFLTSAYRASINPAWYQAPPAASATTLVLPPGVQTAAVVQHSSGLLLPANPEGSR